MAIGSLVVKIGADISQIQRNSQKAAASLGGIQNGANKLGFALKAVGFGLVAREIKQMVGSAMMAIDASTKLAKQLGGTVSGIEGLNLAANEAGVSTEAMTRATEMLNRRLGEAARMGAGQAHDALTRLGIDIEEISQMDVDDRMAAVSDAMIETGMSTQEMADTLGQLGIRTGEVTRLMIDGGDAIRAARGQVEAWGYAINEVDSAKVEAANDAMMRAKKASEGFARQLAVQLSPFITVIANKFVDMSADAGSMSEAFAKAARFIGKAAGFIGDSLRGVHLVFKTLELGGWALYTGLLEAFRAVYKAISFLVDEGIGKQINKAIGYLNMLPKVDITPITLARDGSFMKALDAASEASRATVVDVAKQLKGLATKEWPSAGITKFFNEVTVEAERAAREVVKRRNEIIGQKGISATEPSAAEQKEREARQKKFADELEAIMQHSMTKEEIENAAHARRMEVLNTALGNEQITLMKHAKVAQRIEKTHMKEIARIRKEGMDNSTKIMAESVSRSSLTILGMLKSLTAGAASENKAMFEINKAAAVASAIVSGAQGVAHTYGSLPFPINIPFAAAHAALAAAQVGIIASKQFKGGGGNVAAAPPSVPAAASAPAASQGAGSVTGGVQQEVAVSASGSSYTRDDILNLIEDLNDAVGDGARIRLA